MAGQITIKDTNTKQVVVVTIPDAHVSAVDAQRLATTTFNPGSSVPVPQYPNWIEHFLANALRSVVMPAVQSQAANQVNAVVPKAIAVVLPTFTGCVHGVAMTAQAVGVSGGKGSGYSFTATGLPAGVTVDAATGNISGIPATAGSFVYTVTVSDTDGNKTLASDTLTVA